MAGIIKNQILKHLTKFTKELPSLRNTDGVGDGWKIWGWLKTYLPKHWIKIEIGQELKGSEIVFSIAIGGVSVFSAVNSKPLELTNVKVFASSGWYKPQNGFIKNLLIENKDDAGIEKPSRSKTDYILLVFTKWCCGRDE